jgi:hypothetical protein
MIPGRITRVEEEEEGGGTQEGTVCVGTGAGTAIIMGGGGGAADTCTPGGAVGEGPCETIYPDGAEYAPGTTAAAGG